MDSEQKAYMYTTHSVHFIRTNDRTGEEGTNKKKNNECKSEEKKKIMRKNWKNTVCNMWLSLGEFWFGIGDTLPMPFNAHY